MDPPSPWSCRSRTGQRPTGTAIAPSGAETASGWKIEASSSTPSTRRGPGRLKNAAPSTPRTRASPTEPWRRGRFGGGALGVPAARHGNDDLGLRREHVVPADLPRSRAGDPEDVLATRDPDLLGDPVAGVEQWIEPLEASDARAGASGDLRFDRCEPNREIVDE